MHNEERRALREALNLSRAQVARALEVSPSTVGGWETGRDPAGEVRDRYAYFLSGAQAKAVALAVENTPDTAVGELRPGDRTETAAEHADATDQESEADADDVKALPAPRPCVLCGQDARHQVAGYPQHLDPADCTTAVAAPAAAAPEPPDPAPTPAPASRPAALASKARPGQTRTVKTVRAGGRVQTTGDAPDLIADAVSAALAEHHGDVEAATAALVKRAIPNAMILLDATRKGGRYDIVAHPWIPGILRKQTAKGADRIWEARPKWTRPELPAGRHEVTGLDINGAYLSALKTHLPTGQLERSEGDVHDRRRAGVHLITPPDWDHGAVLPNLLGDRDEDGPLWVTEPTLRLLLRLSGPKYGLCDPPQIHESFTSGATESLLEKFRILLKDARDRAIAEDDGPSAAPTPARALPAPGRLAEGGDAQRCGWRRVRPGRARTRRRSVRSVPACRLAVPPVPIRPAGGGGVPDLETFCGPPQRPGALDDTARQTQPAGRHQRGITVGHEGLLRSGVDVAIHTDPRRPSPVQAPSTRGTNVPGQHSWHRGSLRASMGDEWENDLAHQG